MLKLKYQVNKGTTIEIDLKDVKTAFQFLAYADSVFGVTQCGNCESPNLRYQHRRARTDDGKLCDYYSIICADCKHEFKFGQKQDEGQTLFPKGWHEPYQGGNAGSNGEGKRHHKSEYAGAAAGDDDLGGF